MLCPQLAFLGAQWIYVDNSVLIPAKAQVLKSRKIIAKNFRSKGSGGKKKHPLFFI